MKGKAAMEQKLRLLQDMRLIEGLRNEADRVEREFGPDSVAALLNSQADHLEAVLIALHPDLIPSEIAHWNMRGR